MEYDFNYFTQIILSEINKFVVIIKNQHKLLTSLIEIISFRLRLQCNEIYNRVLEFRFCHFCFMSLCVRLLAIDKCLQLLWVDTMTEIKHE